MKELLVLLAETLDVTADSEKAKVVEAIVKECYNRIPEQQFETIIQKVKNTKNNQNKTSPMMDMMSTMMKGMMDSKMKGGKSPMDMCMQMMGESKPKAKEPEYGTEELADLFKDWCSQLEDEIKEFITSQGRIDIVQIAKEFSISESSTNHIVSRLQKSGNLKI